jgi:hypothetical protein
LIGKRRTVSVVPAGPRPDLTAADPADRYRGPLDIGKSGNRRIFGPRRGGSFYFRSGRRFPGRDRFGNRGAFLFRRRLPLDRDRHHFRRSFFHGSRRGYNRGGFFLHHHHLAAFPTLPPGIAFPVLRLKPVFYPFNKFNPFGFLGII